MVKLCRKNLLKFCRAREDVCVEEHNSSNPVFHSIFLEMKSLQFWSSGHHLFDFQWQLGELCK